MNVLAVAARTTDVIALLRQRESANAAMLRQIDAKISRLCSARRDRAAALDRIRCELARAMKAEPVASESHESR